jgi:hypothetical protein
MPMNHDDLKPLDGAMLSNRVGMLAQFLCVTPPAKLEVSMAEGDVSGEIVRLSRGTRGPTVTLTTDAGERDVSVADILELRVRHD